jgi:hypothetical protein
MERLDDLGVERRRRLGVAVEGLVRHPRVPAPGLALAGEDQLHEVRCKPCRNGDSGGVDRQGGQDQRLAALERKNDRVTRNLVERAQHRFEIGQAEHRLHAGCGPGHVSALLAELLGAERSRSTVLRVRDGVFKLPERREAKRS